MEELSIYGFSLWYGLVVINAALRMWSHVIQDNLIGSHFMDDWTVAFIVILVE